MALDDDDNPLQAPPPAAGPDVEGDDEGDEAPFDMKLFASMFNKRGVANQAVRRGQKDFEQHGTRAQDSALEASRRVIEDVLSYQRTHRDDWIKGWFFPDHWAEALAPGAETPGLDLRTVEWAIHPRDRVVVLEDMKGPQGKSVGRTVKGLKPPMPAVGKVWLMPEEALFMLERGSMDLWWPDRQLKELMPAKESKATGGQDAPTTVPEAADAEEDEYANGVPLSLQAAYALLIGEDGERGRVSLPKYEVYAHLKRSGYFVQRAPEEQDVQHTSAPPTSVLQWLFSLLSASEPSHPSHGPLVRPGLYRNYASIYKQLELLPRFKPSPEPTGAPAPEDPYKVFYHVWRPSKHPIFSKSDPPPPDFRIAVLDARETSVPSLEQLEALFDASPFEPPPESMATPGRMYQRLKHGHRNVLLAIVDRGLVNFMRFGQGAFGEEKLYDRFDASGRGGRGGKRGGRGGRGRGRGRGRGGR